MAAVSSPTAASHLPIPRPEPDRSRRPDLRVVGRPRHSTRYIAVLGLLGAAAVFGIVSLHALAAEAAFEAQALESEIAELSLRHGELTADVAALESPERIRAVATSDLGMVAAEEPAHVALEGQGEEAPTETRLVDPVEQLLAGG